MSGKAYLLITLASLGLVGAWIVLTVVLPTPEVSLSPPQSLGGPYEQVVYGLAADSSILNQVYAGVWGEGVYRSDDGGQNWQARNNGLQNAKNVTTLARAPQSKRLLIGTNGNGIYRSDDDGATWKGVTDLFSPEWYPRTLADNPSSVNALLLTDERGEIVFAGTRYGIRKSTDGGKTWQALDDGLEGAALYVQALAQDPRDGTLYAATWGDGVYTNTANGSRWQPTSLSAQGVLTVASLLVDSKGVIYAGGAEGLGIYRSEDQGQTWLRSDEGITPTQSARTIQALAADASSTLYAGTVDNGVFKSIDGGRTWQPRSSGLIRFGLSILQIAVASDGKTLYVGTHGGGIYRSDDGGEHWQERNQGIPLVAFPVQVLTFGGSRNEWLYVGSDGGGVYVTQDSGKTWLAQNSRLPVEGADRSIQALDISGAVTQTFYAGTQNGLYRAVSSGQGLTWVKQTVDAAAPPSPITSILRRGETLYIAVGGKQPGLYRSRDNGVQWEPIARGLTLDKEIGTRLDTGISLKSGAGNMLYAAIYGKGIYASRDAGDTWTPLPSAPLYIKRLDLVHSNGLLGIGARTTLHAQALESLYVSQDGQVWQPTLLGETAVILADPFRPGLVYASTLTRTLTLSGTQGITSSAVSGIVISQDNGRSWMRPVETDSLVTALAFDPKDTTRLYIGTLNRGAYQSRLKLPPDVLKTSYAMLWGGLFFILVLVIQLEFFSAQYGVSFGEMLWTLVTAPAALSRLLVEPSSLTKLQQLVLAFWPKRDARPEEVQQALEGVKASTSWSQLTAALESLEHPNGLLEKDANGVYHLRQMAFASIAQHRIVQRGEDIQVFAKAVREESRVYQDARQFFRQAGFVPHSTRGGLVLLSQQADTDEGLYVGVFGARSITAEDVNALVAQAREEYHGQVEGRRVYAVVTVPPQQAAYQRIAELAQGSPHLQIVPIGHVAIRQSLDWGTAPAELARSEARTAPDADLYDLESAAIDPLDFFGRQALLQDLERIIEQERAIGLQGLPRIGKTSLLWQLRERLSNHPCVYLDLALVRDQPGELLRALVAELTKEAQVWNFDWRPDRIQVSSFQEEMGHLQQTLAGYRDALRSRLPEPRLLLLMDNVEVRESFTGAELAKLARREPFVQMAVALASRADTAIDSLRVIDVQSFSTSETQVLAQTLLRPLGSSFESAALEQLYRETAGHPQLVRQLCSEVVASGSQEPRLITERDIEQAAWRYLMDRPQLLCRIWEFLTSMEQSVLLALAAEPTDPIQRAQLVPEAQQALDKLEHYGVVSRVNGRYEIASTLLGAWLRMTFPVTPTNR